MSEFEAGLAFARLERRLDEIAVDVAGVRDRLAFLEGYGLDARLAAIEESARVAAEVAEAAASVALESAEDAAEAADQAEDSAEDAAAAADQADDDEQAAETEPEPAAEPEPEPVEETAPRREHFLHRRPFQRGDQ